MLIAEHMSIERGRAQVGLKYSLSLDRGRKLARGVSSDLRLCLDRLFEILKLQLSL